MNANELEEKEMMLAEIAMFRKMNRNLREMQFVDRYQEFVDLFFQQDSVSHVSKEKGHVWISRHKDIDALTVEPPEGGQYEIAIRVPLQYPESLSTDRYSGYYARNGYMMGRNTSGH